MIQEQDLAEFIEKTITELDINLCELLDGKEISFFNTDFGKNFENNCKDLFQFTTVAYKPYLYVILKQYYEPYIFSENFYEKAKKQFELELRGEKKKNTLQALLLLKSIKNETPKEKEEPQEQDLMSFETLEEIKLIPRLVAYFVLTIYAYIDVFIDASYNYICEKAPRKIFPDLSKEFHRSNKIKEQLNSLIRILNKELPGMISKAYRKISITDNKAAFSCIIKLRNEIAHVNPLPKIDELKKNFSKQYKNAKKALLEFGKKFFDEIPEPKTELERDFLNISKKVLTEFEILFVIIEIGLSAMTYLALFEKLLIYSFDPNKGKQIEKS